MEQHTQKKKRKQVQVLEQELLPPDMLEELRQMVRVFAKDDAKIDNMINRAADQWDNFREKYIPKGFDEETLRRIGRLIWRKELTDLGYSKKQQSNIIYFKILHHSADQPRHPDGTWSYSHLTTEPKDKDIFLMKFRRNGEKQSETFHRTLEWLLRHEELVK